MATKAERLRLYPAALGAYLNGQKTLRVANRPDYVWCRIRGSTSEVIQAHNEAVALHWDLPILVFRDPNFPDRWKVYGRDIRQYEDWQGTSYLPPHADSHSFANAPRVGSDPVWIAKRQFMPLLPRPVATGSMSIFIEPDFYYFGGQYNWWPGSGTADMSSYKPTGASNGRFLTVYISGAAGVPAFMVGPEFNAIFPPDDPGDYITLPSPNAGVPLVAVFLLSGTQRLGWGELFDLRLAATPPSSVAGVSGSVIVLDEGLALGSIDRLDFTGLEVTATVSGSYATVNVTGPTVLDEGAPLGAADRLNFTGPGVSVALSGSYANISIPGAGVDQIGVMGLDDGVPIGTGTSIDFGDGLEATLSGTRIRVDSTGGAGGSGSVVIQDEGVTVGSADHLNFVGPGVTAQVSGSYAEITITGGGGDGAGGDSTYMLAGVPEPLDGSTGVYWRVPGGVFATGSLAVFINGLAQSLDVSYDAQHPGSGTYTLSEMPPTGAFHMAVWGVPAGAGGLVSGTVAIYDEGGLVGSLGRLNFRGDGVTVGVSGGFADINIPGGGSAELGLSRDGVVLGDVTDIDAKGQYLVAAVSGSQGYLLGQWIADRVPYISGSPLDQEFETDLLTSPWGITGGNNPLYDLNSTWPSHLHMMLSGSAQNLAVSAPCGYFAIGSGSASVTAAVVFSFADAANANITLAVDNDIPSGAGRNSMRAVYVRVSEAEADIRLDKTVAGVDTFALGARQTPMSTRIYIHLERVSTNQWGAAISEDGLGWIPVSALQTQSLTGLSYVRVTTAVVSTLMRRAHVGVDWIRFNHMFLFS
jgi:hypothetical protein